MIGRRAFARAALVGALLAALPGCARAAPDKPAADAKLDRSHLKLAFEETFAKPPSFYDAKRAPRGRWKTNYFFDNQDIDSPRGWRNHTLPNGKEQEYYGDPVRDPQAFRWAPGSLTLVGQPNPKKDDPRFNGLPYLSGLITTEKSFSQRYGYFEARVTMPVGKGLWPAFWLLPAPKIVNGQPQQVGAQEIDIFENIGQPDEVWFTLHHDSMGAKVGDPLKYKGVDIAKPHTYGLLLTPTDVVWYVDDREVRRRPNTDFTMPAYMLLNLAVGGKWPGYPDETTRFPAEMKIDWVRAWRLVP